MICQLQLSGPNVKFGVLYLVTHGLTMPNGVCHKFEDASKHDSALTLLWTAFPKLPFSVTFFSLPCEVLRQQHRLLCCFFLFLVSAVAHYCYFKILLET